MKSLILKMILLVSLFFVKCQDIDEKYIEDNNSNDYVNNQSKEYEEMLLVVREMALEFDQLRNQTLVNTYMFTS